MKLIDAVLLLVLSLVWSSSFIFLRVLSPVLGPFVTADGRMLLGGLALVFLYMFTGPKLDWKRNWRPYLVVGLVNSALPFAFYAFAALLIPAALSVILNATSPLFGLLLGALFLGEKLTFSKILGLVLGFAGVVLVSSWGLESSASTWWGVLLCLAATFCYALSGIYIKKKTNDISSQALSAGSLTFGGLVLLIPAGAASPVGWSLETAGLLLLFALLCSSLAFLMYFRLMKSLGPTKTLTVTFLMPVFGLAWGAFLLKESVTPLMILGAAVVLIGTYFVVRKEREK